MRVHWHPKYPITDTRAKAEIVAADVAKFLARGGVIERLHTQPERLLQDPVIPLRQRRRTRRSTKEIAA